MATHSGDLFEERSAFLGAQREGLVHHPLPDEQEGVVGKMRRVQQVDQIAQADPALVQEVVVLARPIEPPAELQDLEVDREQAIGIVEDECDIRHPLRGPLLRTRPDDILRLSRAECATLFAECPAQGVGEVAFAGAIRPDDGADARPELDVRPLGERLESLETERQKTRFGGPTGIAHGPAPSGSGPLPRPRSRSRACAAAAVSAVRRDGPSPTPSKPPSTHTSMRNERS